MQSWAYDRLARIVLCTGGAGVARLDIVQQACSLGTSDSGVHSMKWRSCAFPAQQGHLLTNVTYVHYAGNASLPLAMLGLESSMQAEYYLIFLVGLSRQT